MANVTFDKKQLPQVAALGTLSACMFGYFGFKMLVPPATQAAPPAPTTGTSSGTGASGSAGASSSATDATSGAANETGDAVDPSALIGAGAPSAAMRDPFAAAATPSAGKTISGATSDSAPKALPALAELKAAQGKQAASGASGLPPLPGASPADPAPVIAPQIVSPAAQWGVSGVICSDINPSLSLAIFRAGNVRRYVKVGEWLDNTTQLISLDRSGVVLMRSGMRFRLPIGAGPEAPSAAAPQQQQASPTSMTPAPAPALPQLPPLPQQHAELPAPPAQAHPVVTIADASISIPVEKVGDSVQVSRLGVTVTNPDGGTDAAPAPEPTDADSPASGAMDVPTFNSDLPAQADGGGQLQPVAWASQDGGAPLASLLLASDPSGAALDLSSGGSANPFGLNDLTTPQTQAGGGFGMKLVTTPSSVLQALGIDSSLFIQPSVPAATAASATSDGGLAALPSSAANIPDAADSVAAASADTEPSVFQQYDAITAADMARIACIDQPGAEVIMAPDAPSAPEADQADFNPLSALGVAFQQDFHWLSKEFTS